MKKVIILLAILLSTFLTGAYAQYQKGDILINAGLSLGAWGYGYGLYAASSGFLPLTASVEYSMNDQLALGPYAGLYTRTYKYSGYKDRFTALSFGARGTFHASRFLNEHLHLSIDLKKLDLYATMIVGFEVRSWNFDADYDGDPFYSNEVSFDLGPVLGVRYNFSPSFGAFFEAGRGSFGLGTIGLSAKL